MEQYRWAEMQWISWILFLLHRLSHKWAQSVQVWHSGHEHGLVCLSVLCVCCVSMYIGKNPYKHCLKTSSEPQRVLRAYLLRLITRCWDPSEYLRAQELSYQQQKIGKKKFYNSSNSKKIQIPLTIRSAAADSLSTLVCTMQTYFPACFSWMLLIIKSPAESCW